MSAVINVTASSLRLEDLVDGVNSKVTMKMPAADRLAPNLHSLEVKSPFKVVDATGESLALVLLQVLSQAWTSKMMTNKGFASHYLNRIVFAALDELLNNMQQYGPWITKMYRHMVYIWAP